MKKLIAFAALSALFSSLHAQSISGKITNLETGEPLADAKISIPSIGTSAFSVSNGDYVLKLEKAGTYQVLVSKTNYDTLRLQVAIGGKQALDFALIENMTLLDPVSVKALRAGSKAPIAKSNMSHAEIEARDEGRDIPYILKDLPSTVVSSDAGTGIGYTGIRIRGSDISRINVTVNGVPINDPESHGVFWVNMPDLSSSTQSVQVQRGVGTSTNGAGAFGASINMKTSNINAQPYGQVEFMGGSFNSLKTNLNVGSGLLNDHWIVEGRLSQITSDGFIDRANANLKSYYLSGSYYSKNSSIQLIHFAGAQETYQAWWGIPEVKLNNDSAGIQNYIWNNGLDSAQAYNIKNADNRTYNYYEYDRETDNYWQDHYQLHGSHRFNKNWKGNLALHYTHGEGYFEQYKRDEDLADYGLNDVIMGGDTITSTDLIRRRWLDNDFIGTTFSLEYEADKLNVTLGGAYNYYEGDHYGEIIWAEYASNSEIRDRYYDNTSKKSDFNIFTKAVYDFGKLSIFGDIQYRNVYYTGTGTDSDRLPIDLDETYNFVNPKFGLNYELNEKERVYASASIGQREPVRADFLDAVGTAQPKPEKMMDYEAGYELRNKKSFFNVNAFFMDYTNQLVLTGQLNDVGTPIRENAPDSYRAGLELMGTYRVNSWLEAGANVAFSKNEIKNYTYGVIDYDNGGYQTQSFNSSPISYSPDVIGGIQLGFIPIQNALITLNSKYVSDQFMDNTGSAARSIDAFTVTDLRLEYILPVKLVKEIKFHVLVANLFDEKYEPNGYTYSYIYGGQTITDNHYFTMAGINVMAGIKVRF